MLLPVPHRSDGCSRVRLGQESDAAEARLRWPRRWALLTDGWLSVADHRECAPGPGLILRPWCSVTLRNLTEITDNLWGITSDLRGFPGN